MLEDWDHRLCLKGSFGEARQSLELLLGLRVGSRALEQMNRVVAGWVAPRFLVHLKYWVWQIFLARTITVSQGRQGPFPPGGSCHGIDAKLSRDEFIAQMREKFEEALGKVADAVNEAPPGRIIAGSEEQVRDAFADLRKHAFETALQMRLDAAEAAFPPSEGPDHGQDQA